MTPNSPDRSAPHASGGVGGWEVASGWTVGGYLGLVQGAVILSRFTDGMARTPVLLLSFLLHGALVCVTGVLWSAAYLQLGRAVGRHPSRAEASAAFFSLLFFIISGIYVHVTRLPGTNMFTPIGIGVTAALAFVSLALVPLWRMPARRWFSSFENRGGLRSRLWLTLEGIRILAVLAVSLVPPLVWDGSRAAPASRPAPEGLPNVLVFVMDTTRSDHLSCYGYDRPTTPVLDSLSARGILFEDAVSPSPWTLPSHASLLTGRFPRTHGATWQHWRLDDSNPTLAEALARAGYATGAFVSNPFLSRVFNLDQGFDVYDDELEPWVMRTYFWALPVRLGLVRLSGPRYSERRADHTAAAALRWVRNLGARPYFLFVNFNDPHAPYDPPEEFRRRFLSNPAYAGPLLDPSSHDDFVFLDEGNLTTADMDYVTDLYDGEILFLDGVVGRFLKALERVSRGRDAITVAVGDHGESFGEHGMLGHRGSLYNPTLRVPLILSRPGKVPENVRVSTRVQTHDIAPTLLDLLGLEIPPEMEGVSLARLWAESSEDPSRDCFAELFPEPELGRLHPRLNRRLTAVFRDSLKLIRSSDGSVELFDLGADPGEGNDLSPSEAELARRLAEVLSARPGAMEGHLEPISLNAGTVSRLRSMGYLH